MQFVKKKLKFFKKEKKDFIKCNTSGFYCFLHFRMNSRRESLMFEPCFLEIKIFVDQYKKYNLEED